jgi:hypothetical protein
MPQSVIPRAICARGICFFLDFRAAAQPLKLNFRVAALSRFSKGRWV